MRVLFTGLPIPAHLFPAVPLAWALQGAGHEVCFASPPDLSDTITAAGLTAVALGTKGDAPALAATPDFDLAEDELAGLTEVLSTSPRDRNIVSMFGNYLLPAMRVFHAGAASSQRCDWIDDLVDFAQAWQPDLVISDLWPSAAVAARLAGAAHCRLIWGPDYLGWFAERRDQLRAAGLRDPLSDLVEPVAERFGMRMDDELLFGQWTLDPIPAELRAPTRTRVVPMRRVPYTGTGVLPGWIHPRPERPRVALTLGASARDYWSNDVLVNSMLEMVGELDIEVIATLNHVQVSDLKIPDNVRTIPYLPLTQLLPTCSALIHHGGGGTLAAAVAHQVPQLVESGGVEAWVYSDYLTKYGAGVVVNHEEHSVVEMRKQLVRVLHEPSFREGTQRLHANWLAMPSPNDIVPVLEKLTAAHR